jgi:glycosyltransferase involved in cell wall biosynthesis
MNLPWVTIVCLCYNHEKFVLECLKSIENQTYPNIEIIVVDDFSQDKSAIVIKEYLKNKPYIPFIENKTNLGSTKSFNQALRMSKGEFIMDLASDDVLLPNSIAVLIEGFQKSTYQNLAAVFGNCLEIAENGDKLNYFFEVDDNENVIQPIKTGDIYETIIGSGKNRCSASALFRKEVYIKLNAYDESLFYEDLDLWVRASRIYNFDYVDQVVIKKRVVQNSMGTLFHAKNDPRRKIINRSAWVIAKKAFHLNRSKSEDKSLLQRVHYNIILNYQLRDWRLMLQYVLLALKLRKRIWF